MRSISTKMHDANRQAVFYEEMLTNALHYIANIDGTILDYLENYNLTEDWNDFNCAEFFGFNNNYEELDI